MKIHYYAYFAVLFATAMSPDELTQPKPAATLYYVSKATEKPNTDKEKEEGLQTALIVVSAFGKLLSGALVGSCSGTVVAGIPYFTEGVQQLLSIIKMTPTIEVSCIED